MTSLYYREGFFPCFQFLYCIQRNLSRIISKQIGREDFSMEQLPIDSYMLLCPSRGFPTIVWQNAQVNTSRRAIMCYVHFSFSKIL